MNYEFITVLGILTPFLMTTLGSAVVYFFKKDISQTTNCLLLSFASGIMFAASIWSLLLPSIEQSSSLGSFNWLPATLGIVLGGLFLVLLDKIIIYLQKKKDIKIDYNLDNNLLIKSKKLFLAVTVHNIPEGLAVGFAFGAAFVSGEYASFIAALGLALGIAIQNFPEGLAVSLPIKVATQSKHKGFLYGIISGVIEPIFAVIGYFLATYLTILQPWLLAFSAGAMIFVVVGDLLTETKTYTKTYLSTWFFVIGFLIMMILDVALG